MIRPIPQPKLISPELVEIGDKISVEHKQERGITTVLSGIVGKRVDSGSTRYYMTTEGATLFAYDPSKPRKIKIVLFARDEHPQSTLFELPSELEQRMTG